MPSKADMCCRKYPGREPEKDPPDIFEYVNRQNMLNAHAIWGSTSEQSVGSSGGDC